MKCHPSKKDFAMNKDDFFLSKKTKAKMKGKLLLLIKRLIYHLIYKTIVSSEIILWSMFFRHHNYSHYITPLPHPRRYELCHFRRCYDLLYLLLNRTMVVILQYGDLDIYKGIPGYEHLHDKWLNFKENRTLATSVNIDFPEQQDISDYKRWYLT